MLRTSKPRTLYSPPSTRRSNSGSGSELPQARMYSVSDRKPNDVRRVCCRNWTYSNRGL